MCRHPRRPSRLFESGRPSGQVDGTPVRARRSIAVRADHVCAIHSRVAGFFDSNNMPILCQIPRPELRATGYGIMNLVSISCGGLADWGFGTLRDRRVPLFGIFGTFGGAAVLSIVLV